MESRLQIDFGKNLEMEFIYGECLQEIMKKVVREKELVILELNCSF